jgi:cytidylate kinase
MKLCISGLTACGKSYQARKIAETFGLKYLSGSDYLLEVAEVTPVGDLFWINDYGEKFTELRNTNYNVDRRADEMILQAARNEGSFVFDSWTLPWLYRDGDLYKIYLDADFVTRVQIAHQSRTVMPYSLYDIRKKIAKKDRDSARLFKEVHGIDIFDHSFFDLVVDNSNMGPEETSGILNDAINLRFGVIQAAQQAVI